RAMMRVIKADLVSNRGLRNVLDGELILLQGFDFNGNAPLSATVYAPYTATINRATGLLDVEVPSFTPDSQIVAPGGTTHLRLVSAGAEVDFENETFVLAQSVSEETPFKNTATSANSVSNDIGVTDSTKPLFLVLGIGFLQEVNGSFYALNNGAFNALNLVAVDTGIDDADEEEPEEEDSDNEDDDTGEEEGDDPDDEEGDG